MLDFGNGWIYIVIPVQKWLFWPRISFGPNLSTSTKDTFDCSACIHFISIKIMPVLFLTCYFLSSRLKVCQRSLQFKCFYTRICLYYRQWTHFFKILREIDLLYEYYGHFHHVIDKTKNIGGTVRVWVTVCRPQIF